MNNICVKNTKLIMVIFISSFSTIQVFSSENSLQGSSTECLKSLESIVLDF